MFGGAYVVFFGVCVLVFLGFGFAPTLASISISTVYHEISLNIFIYYLSILYILRTIKTCVIYNICLCVFFAKCYKSVFIKKNYYNIFGILFVCFLLDIVRIHLIL